jgi:hypothetical protein
LPGEPGVVTSTHPAADEANQALPPAPDKTTAPRQVDASGSPLPADRFDPAAQPSTMTDTPVTPPAPEGRDQLDSPAAPAASEGKVVSPAPNRTSTTPKSEPRMAAPPATPAPPPSPGLDMTRSPWGEGPNDVR